MTLCINKGASNTKPVLLTYLLLLLAVYPINTLASNLSPNCTLDVLHHLGIVLRPPNNTKANHESDMISIADIVSKLYTHQHLSTKHSSLFDLSARTYKEDGFLETSLISLNPFHIEAAPKSKSQLAADNILHKLYNITHTSMVFTDPQDKTVEDVLNALAQFLTSRKHLENSSMYKLGLRTQRCPLLTQAFLAHPELMERSHFIDILICQTFHSAPADIRTLVQNTTQGWEVLATLLNSTKQPKLIKLMGETAWPSVPDSKLENTAELKGDYWCQMGIWARAKGIPVYMEGAFDDPWEVYDNQGEKGLVGWETFKDGTLTQKIEIKRKHVPASVTIMSTTTITPKSETSGATSWEINLLCMSLLGFHLISTFQ